MALAALRCIAVALLQRFGSVTVAFGVARSIVSPHGVESGGLIWKGLRSCLFMLCVSL